MKKIVIIFVVLVLLGTVFAIFMWYKPKESGENSVSGAIVVEKNNGTAEEKNTTTVAVDEEEVEEIVEKVEEIKQNTSEAAKEVVHKIELVNESFPVSELKIKKGEKVVWENSRTTEINEAMILGGSNCQEIKSGIFYPGESFSWVFDEETFCTIVDGIFTSQTMKVIVE